MLDCRPIDERVNDSPKSQLSVPQSGAAIPLTSEAKSSPIINLWIRIEFIYHSQMRSVQSLPWNGSEAKRERYNEDTERNDRQPTEAVNARFISAFHEEVNAEHESAQSHHRVGNQQQDSTTQSIDDKSSNKGCQHLHHSNDDCGDFRVDSSTGCLENVSRVEDDSVDAGNLLEEHQTEADNESTNRSLSA